MLRTALKPVWLITLLLALLAAALFVALSRWQFQSAETAAPPPRVQTENAVPLTAHVRPGEPLLASQADQIVTARGEFLPVLEDETRRLCADRAAAQQRNAEITVSVHLVAPFVVGVKMGACWTLFARSSSSVSPRTMRRAEPPDSATTGGRGT